MYIWLSPQGQDVGQCLGSGTEPLPVGREEDDLPEFGHLARPLVQLQHEGEIRHFQPCLGGQHLVELSL